MEYNEIFACVGYPLLGMVLIVIIAAGVTILGQWEQKQRNWSTTEGEITQLGEVKIFSRGGGSESGGNTYYAREIFFTYVVEGRHYTGSNGKWGRSCSPSDVPPARELEYYPPRTKIEVYYNPYNPEETRLFKYGDRYRRVKIVEFGTWLKGANASQFYTIEKCPSCEALNTFGVRFCAKCGTPLNE